MIKSDWEEAALWKQQHVDASSYKWQKKGGYDATATGCGTASATGSGTGSHCTASASATASASGSAAAWVPVLASLSGISIA